MKTTTRKVSLAARSISCLVYSCPILCIRVSRNVTIVKVVSRDTGTKKERNLIMAFKILLNC